MFAAVRSKSFLQTPSDTLPDAPLNPPTGPTFNPPTGPSFNPPAGPAARPHPRPFPNPTLPTAQPQAMQPNLARKRTFDDREVEDQHRGSPGPPAAKFARRGNMRMAAPSARAGVQQYQQQYSPTSTAMPYAQPAMNGGGMMQMPQQQQQNADLASAIPMMMAQIQAMGAILSGMAGGSPGGGGRGRCFDYDTKGFCARGSTCPYEHGANAVNAPPGPQNYPGFNDHGDSGFTSHSRSNGFPNGNARGRNGRGGRGSRAPFASVGPNRDPSITTIVVQNIPPDNYSEDQVREFFSAFGPIVEITMQTHPRLALVKYEDNQSAMRAYQSPKTVFNNRFVKIFWYKPVDQNGSPAASDKQQPAPRSPSVKSEDAAQIAQDLEKKLEDAQRKHEEKQKSMEEARSKKAELDERLRQHAEEAKKLRQAIAAKEKNGTDGGEPSSDAEETKDNKDLKAQIARLEAEALGLGLNPDDPYTADGGALPQYPYAPRRRGGYRGRAWHPRGGGRGRGRGSAFAASRGGAPVGVMRLDNRPKKVAINVAEGSPRDEALRSFLIVVSFPLLRKGCVCEKI